MFNLFKKIVKETQKKETVAFFKNGQLTNVVPMPEGNLYDNREVFYNARYIISEHCKYDLENEESIRSIITPDFKMFNILGLDVVGNLVYVLRMKASYLKKEGKKELALALLKRATEMMPTSGILWTKRDYMRFYNWLCEAGEFEAAHQAKNCIDELFKTSLNLNKQVNDINMRNANELSTDLVEASYFNGCCGECAKYRGRWFSISGEDKRFPKMPENYGCTCQGIDFLPVIYIYDISEPTYCPQDTDIITWSNRPFIDNRTKEEKELHQHYLDAKVFERIKYQDKEDYESLLRLIPDEMPKSFSAYRRMKMSETDKFMSIAEKASVLGFDIKLSMEDKVIIERYNKYEKALKENKK